jgi:phage baseplate assembly protein W
MIFAPSIPLQFDDENGYKNVNDIRELVKFHLTNLLLTNPGEKISDSEYGVGIRQFLFENQSEDAFSRIRSRINSQVSSKLNYLTLRNVIVRSLDNYENAINIQLVYRIDNINLEDMLNLNLNLNSGVALFADTSY